MHVDLADSAGDLKRLRIAAGETGHLLLGGHDKLSLITFHKASRLEVLSLGVARSEGQRLAPQTRMVFEASS